MRIGLRGSNSAGQTLLGCRCLKNQGVGTPQKGQAMNRPKPRNKPSQDKAQGSPIEQMPAAGEAGDDRFLLRNAGLAHAVAALFNRLDRASDAATLSVIAELRATLRAAGLNFTRLANAIDELPFAAMADDWESLVTFCTDRYGELSEKEASLIDTLQDWKGEPTGRQLGWLTAIARRLYFTELAAT
jgi:hypothetical protein